MSNYIPSLGSSGKPDGGVYAINPAGDLVGTKLVPVKGDDGKTVLGLKKGWRAATQADLKAKADAEAKRQADAKKGG